MLDIGIYMGSDTVTNEFTRSVVLCRSQQLTSEVTQIKNTAAVPNVRSCGAQVYLLQLIDLARFLSILFSEFVRRANLWFCWLPACSCEVRTQFPLQAE